MAKRSILSVYPDLPALLNKAVAIPYKDHAFRVVPGSSIVHKLRFKHLWAGNAAGRFNPAGVSRLYLSIERKTADREFSYYQKSAGFNPYLVDFYSFSVEVNLSRVLELRDRNTRKLFGISRAKILQAWEPDPLAPSSASPTRLQAIGYCTSKGIGNFSGIIAPSARKATGHNIVIFKGRLSVGDSVKPLSPVATTGWT